ncbi:MAG TPA: S-layer homology domain-containing protein [Thermoanaerobaculia bacterium]
MTSNPILGLRRGLVLGAALVFAGVVAAGANSVQVPNGVVSGGSPCSAANPNAARFGQSCGAQVSVTAGDTTPAYLQENSPSGEGTYRARFYLNLRTLQMQSGEEFEVFAAYTGADPAPGASSGVAAIRLIVQQTGAQKELVAVARLDSGTEFESPAILLPNAWRAVEIEWAKATAAVANNGKLDVWVDGTKRTTNLTGLDNDTLTINYARWGAVAGLDAGTSGTFRLDDFSSQRSGYIGPALPFSDNPTSNSFFPFIQGIYAAEVMPGCAVGTFCPSNAITRKEMAQFLLKARYGASFTPPACTTPMFSDVPCSHPYAIWINEIARQGITGGCSPGIFCPDGNITRGQMAVFLMVAVGATTTPCPPSSFLDVPASNSFCPFINEIARRGITAGCGNGNFCPNDLVLRGQMSVFLSTNFGLPTHAVGQ